MIPVRLRLSVLAACWLVVQAAVLAVAPVTLVFASAAIAGECECPGGMALPACPMHRSPNRGANPEGDREIRGACSPDDAVLLSMGMGLGVLPVPVAVTLASVDGDVESFLVSSASRSVPPDPIPPRARHAVS
jgi:hypothetical protein